MADNQLYSRQTSTYGGKMMGHLMSLKIHIIGCGPLAFECAKNLILSGIQNLSFETSTEIITDCYQNFAFSDKEIGKSKVESLIQFMYQLNPQSSITTKSILTKDNWKDECDILIVATDEKIKSNWIEWNLKCRQQQIWYLIGYLDNANKCAFCWQDPGESHQIWDIDGEKNKDIMITQSKKESETIFNIQVGTLQHNLCYNDEIKSSNWDSIGKVVHVMKNEIKIQFEIAPENVESGVYISRIPHTKKVNGITLDNYLSSTFEEMNNYHNYAKLGKELKPIWEHFWSEESTIFNNNNSSIWYPLVSQIGGIIAQEAMKRIGKFTPLVGAYYADCQEICLNSRLRKPIEETNVFVVGAGALGCEALKNLVMMGFGRNNSKIIITDMDSIELSNLSRQFLYRQKDIGKLKSVVAKEAIQEYFPEINIEAYTIAVGKNSLETFNDTFWNSLDIVINALDNIEARKFVDSQCVWYKKPLFESGTLGMKGNTQIILPDYTQTYSDSRDPPSEDVPVCTIKHYPYQQSHCIQWAREMFESLFGKDGLNDKMDVDDDDDDDDEEEENEDILLSILQPQEIYQKWFIDDIKVLHKKHPKESLNEDGTPFWGGQRRFPKPFEDNSYIEEWCLLTEKLFQDKMENNGCISFEKDEDLNGHIQWIMLTTNARSFNYDIPQCSFQECKEIAGNITPAVATITSVVMGFVFDEIMKYMNNVESSKFYNTFLNLGINMILMSEPMEAIQQEGKEWDSVLACQTRTYNGDKFTCWNQLKIDGKKNQIKTVKDLCQYLESTFKIDVVSLYSPTQILYNDINPQTLSYLETIIRKDDSDSEYKIFIDAEDIEEDISVLFPIVVVK